MASSKDAGGLPPGSVSQEYLDELIARLMEKDERIRALESEKDEIVAATNSIVVLPDDEQPRYEVLSEQGFFSQDCTLYPKGAIVRDLTGFMPLNPELQPMNGPAEHRMRSYMESLPGEPGKQPTLDDIIDAAFKSMPTRSDDPGAKADYYANVMKNAYLAKHTRESGQDKAVASKKHINMPKRQGDAPLMSNTRQGGVSPHRPAAVTALKSAPMQPEAPMQSRGDMLQGGARTGR